jgi:hypothetical protein
VQLDGTLQRQRSFASWLPKHAALVNSITIVSDQSNARVRFIQGPPSTAEAAAAEELRQALEVAALMPARGDTAAAPSSAADKLASSVHQGLLRLTSFNTDMPGAAGMLAAVPAHSLTRLEPHLGCDHSIDYAALSAALAQLSKLQQMHISGACDALGSCLAGIAQLSCLTGLRLAGDWNDEMLVLPAQLQQLELGRSSNMQSLAALTGLQQLQRLRFEACWGSADQQLLLALGQLPALQHLEMKFADAACDVDTIAALPQLPQLRALTVWFSWNQPSYEDWEEVLEAVAACTGLTKLDITAGAVEEPLPPEQNDEGLDYVAACASLAGLSNLRDLSLSGRLVPGDALALTALTGLTRLGLELLGDGVGDLAACALACSLKQLRHLDLKQCGLGGMVCLGAIAHLTQLTELCLMRNAGITQQGLMLLTRLTNLQWIGVNVGDGITAEDVAQFQALVPGVEVEAVDAAAYYRHDYRH